MSFSSKNLKRVVITPTALGQLLTMDGNWKTNRGVPEGSKFCGMTFDPPTNTIHIFIEHSIFPEIPEGSTIPELPVEFITQAPQSDEDEHNPFDLYNCNRYYPKITLY